MAPDREQNHAEQSLLRLIVYLEVCVEGAREKPRVRLAVGADGEGAGVNQRPKFAFAGVCWIFGFVSVGMNVLKICAVQRSQECRMD